MLSGEYANRLRRDIKRGHSSTRGASLTVGIGPAASERSGSTLRRLMIGFSQYGHLLRSQISALLLPSCRFVYAARSVCRRASEAALMRQTSNGEGLHVRPAAAVHPAVWWNVLTMNRGPVCLFTRKSALLIYPARHDLPA